LNIVERRFQVIQIRQVLILNQDYVEHVVQSNKLISVDQCKALMQVFQIRHEC